MPPAPRSSRSFVFLSAAALVAVLIAGCSGGDDGRSLLDAPAPSASSAAASPAPAGTAIPNTPAGSANSGRPPQLQTPSLLRPVFITGAGAHEGGAAWLTTAGDGQTLLVTAHHSLGRAPITGTRSSDPYGDVSLATGPPLVIADASGAAGSRAQDVAAFAVPDPGPVHPFPIAEQEAADGDLVWLFAEPDIGGGARLYEAEVALDASVPAGTLRVRWGVGAIDSEQMPQTSGAPFLNSAGQVVGLISDVTDGNGTRISTGPNATALRTQLAKAR